MFLFYFNFNLFECYALIPYHVYYCIVRPHPVVPRLLLHHPPLFVLADCYVQIEKPSACASLTCPGEHCHPNLAAAGARTPTPCPGAHRRPRFSTRRGARVVVLPGRLAPSPSNGRRRACVIVLPGRARITIPSPQFRSRRDAVVGVSPGRTPPSPRAVAHMSRHALMLRDLRQTIGRSLSIMS